MRYVIGTILPNDRAGTLAANIIGVCLATILLIVLDRRGVDQLRLLLLPGFCAGLTTFSAVAAQSLEPTEGGILFLVQNIVFTLLAIIVIMPLARRVVKAK